MDPPENPTPGYIADRIYREKTITPEMTPGEDDVLLIDPRMFLRILHFDGRKAPRKMQTVVYAIRRNAAGPIWSARDFDYWTDAEAFADIVRTAGGKVEDVTETTL